MQTLEAINIKHDAFWTNFWLLIFVSVTLTFFFILYRKVSPLDKRPLNHQQSTAKTQKIYYNLGINLQAIFDHSLKAKKN